MHLKILGPYLPIGFFIIACIIHSIIKKNLSSIEIFHEKKYKMRILGVLHASTMLFMVITWWSHYYNDSLEGIVIIMMIIGMGLIFLFSATILLSSIFLNNNNLYYFFNWLVKKSN